MKSIVKAASILALIVAGIGLVWFFYVPLHVAKAAVKLKLNDPDSAQFRNVRKVNRLVVCGEVNAKNAMGGYVGFTPFSVLDWEMMLRRRGFGGFTTSPAATMKVTFAPATRFFLQELERQLAELDADEIKKYCEPENH